MNKWAIAVIASAVAGSCIAPRAFAPGFIPQPASRSQQKGFSLRCKPICPANAPCGFGEIN